ncbi:MAG: proline--tRNA ligase [Planctomycetaceae bacterium]|jgi:prolyl-tRNA synthetase|nr:proline--tRNA ligase [Planctomycetaceae bacterium]
MYWSKTLIPTMKETPDGAEIPSHVLMLRAGLIAQVMAGAYTYLPLGLRSLQKATQMVREEMNRAGAVELLMSSLCPISLYEQTNRVETFGDVLIKTQLPRGGKKISVVLCPTHEEEITDLVSRYVSSYRQLPITLYQIQTKFRNEERPRFGVLRTSEFIMKDAYSFHTTLESLDETYKKMYDAYCKIFQRCGLPFLPVEAESGPIGGDASHEFMIPSPNGEDKIVHCEACGYAANIEKAEIGSNYEYQPPGTITFKPMMEFDTPNAHTVEQLCKAYNVKPTKLIKTLIYVADYPKSNGSMQPIAVLIRGDHEANENKIKRVLNATKLELADAKTVETVTGAPVGFAGPAELAQQIPIYADYAVIGITNAVVGANKAGKHFVNVNPFRTPKGDWTPDKIDHFRNAVDGDACPRCSATMKIREAIEVGHVFKLGTKYSDCLNAKFLDADETQKTIIMGCYGIGVNRIIAGLIETSYDDAGMIWPVNLAPYEVVICPMKVFDEQSMKLADELAQYLQTHGQIDCLIDDRDQRPGVKFKDIDLIGFPLRIVIGDKGLAEGNIETKWRWEKETTMIPINQAAETIIQWIKTERNTSERFSNRTKK